MYDLWFECEIKISPLLSHASLLALLIDLITWCCETWILLLYLVVFICMYMRAICYCCCCWRCYLLVVTLNIYVCLRLLLLFFLIVAVYGISICICLLFVVPVVVALKMFFAQLKLCVCVWVWLCACQMLKGFSCDLCKVGGTSSARFVCLMLLTRPFALQTILSWILKSLPHQFSGCCRSSAKTFMIFGDFSHAATSYCCFCCYWLLYFLLLCTLFVCYASFLAVTRKTIEEEVIWMW